MVEYDLLHELSPETQSGIQVIGKDIMEMKQINCLVREYSKDTYMQSGHLVNGSINSMRSNLLLPLRQFLVA